LRSSSFLGTDMRARPGVARVCKVEDLPFLVGTVFAGVVVSTEMLEPAPDWAAAGRGMVLVLAPGGLLLLTTRGPGFPVHGYPEDHWRFTPEAMESILGACGLEILRCEPDPDPASPGGFALARRPPGWKRPNGWKAALAAGPVGVPGCPGGCSPAPPGSPAPTHCATSWQIRTGRSRARSASTTKGTWAAWSPRWPGTTRPGCTCSPATSPSH